MGAAAPDFDPLNLLLTNGPVALGRGTSVEKALDRGLKRLTAEVKRRIRNPDFGGNVEHSDRRHAAR
jgi:hypothetical protein